MALYFKEGSVNKFTIGVLLLVYSTFVFSETKDCISPEQEIKFTTQLGESLKEYSLNDIEVLLELRELSFKDGALNTINKIDQHLFFKISSLLILDNVTTQDVNKISDILSLDSYYPFTWEDEYKIKIKERLKNKIQSN